MSLKEGIVVKFYQDFRSSSQDASDHSVQITDYGKTFSAEELIILGCKYKKIGPSGFYIFGLREFGDSGRWMTPNEEIECSQVILKEFVLRVRFIPSLNGLYVLGKECKEAFNYFFLQCRHDFVKENIVLKKKIGQECVLGLGVLDMLRWGKENTYDLLDLKKEDPRNFIPVNSKRRFKSLWDKSKLKSNVNSELEKLFTNGVTVTEYKARYIHGFIKYCQQYGIESYKTGESGTVVVVDPHHEENTAIYLQRESKLLLKEQEVVGICSIQDVMFINKGSLTDERQVTISRKHGGKPETLHFTSESDAESFISVVEGYHRLLDDFHYQVCPQISSPMVAQLSRIKSHGPVGKMWAIDRLNKKHKIQKEFNFLLRQDGSDFGSYVIHYITSSPNSEMKNLLVSQTAEGRWHFREAEEPKFPRVLDLLQHYISKSDRKVVLRYVPPIAPMDPNLFLCRKDPKEEETDERQNHEVKSQVNLISGIINQGKIGSGTYTELQKVLWNKGPNHLQKVAVKRLKQQYSPQYIEELMEGMHRVTFWRCPTLVSVQAIILHPFQVVLEHAEHGNLEEHMQNVPMSDLDQVSIADQLAQALLYIHENVQGESGQNSGYHGNIRSRNVFVFDTGTGSQNSSLKVKLGDPGMLALYNKLPLDNVVNEERLPWIAPELYSTTVNLASNNQYSDIYSFGVFLWEVFSDGERPFDLLNIKEILRTVLYKGGLEPPEGCFQGVGELISKCLQKEVEKRPNAKEIVRDLGKVMHDFSGRGNQYNMATYNQSLYQAQGREHSSVDLSESEQIAVIDSLVEQSSTTARQHLNFESFPSVPGHSDPQSPVSVVSQSPGNSFYDSRAPLIPRDGSVESNPSTFRNHRLDSEPASGASQTTVTTEISFDDTGNPHPTDAIQDRPLPSTPKPKIPIADLKHIVHPERLHLEKDAPLGKGHYGEVHRALYTLPSGKKQIVAVKSLNAVMYNRFHKEFDKECKMMTQLEHPNIVQIIGQCFGKNNHETLLVMEFVEQGSLRDFLRKGVLKATDEQRVKQYITEMTPRLLPYCREMCEGMIYLSERKIVHRDLAARNILVTKDEVMKISDFGLARNLNPTKNYYSMSDRKQELPAFWCAPESLELKKFSTASDVWSFGVTMWEVYTLGHQPKLCDVELLLSVLSRNQRLRKPKICPEPVYGNVMHACWALEPEKRITFQSIASTLKAFQEVQTTAMKSTNPFVTQTSQTLPPVQDRTPVENSEQKVQANTQLPEPASNSLLTSLHVPTSLPLVNGEQQQPQQSQQSMSLPPPLQVAEKSNYKIPSGVVNRGLSQERSLPEVPKDSEHILDSAELQIEKDRRLGAGHYGEVHRALYKDKKVAVKILKSKMVDKYWREFEKECKMMAKLKHDHIVQVIGQCTKSISLSNGEPQEQMVLVMEYVERGSLKVFLREEQKKAKEKNSHNWRLDLRSQIPQLIQFMGQIAQGMCYLHNVSVVHRDLAARNVLVTKDNTMKISDFGLARTLGGDKDYYKMSDQKEGIPALWCAPEALDHRKFSKETDVWSFGVTAWEVITFGKEPELCRIEQLSPVLKRGNRLPKSELCDDNLYTIMKNCWDSQPENRPDFEDLIQQLNSLL